MGRESKGTGRQNKAGFQKTEGRRGGMHRGYMWVCISMLAVARRHRLSLMKYFCSQSCNRGYSPSMSLALILLSSLSVSSLSSCNSSRPSVLSSLHLSFHLLLCPSVLLSLSTYLVFLYAFLGSAPFINNNIRIQWA